MNVSPSLYSPLSVYVGGRAERPPVDILLCGRLYFRGLSAPFLVLCQSAAGRMVFSFRFGLILCLTCEFLFRKQVGYICVVNGCIKVFDCLLEVFLFELDADKPASGLYSAVALGTDTCEW